jgi:diguanylate cyclase (GGDEF)-like protein
VVLALIAVVALVSGVRARTLALRQRAARLDRLVAERTAALAEANQQLERLARTDPLTGLVNRRGFSESLDSAWRACALRSEPLALLALDVDAFKAYNDGYGHPAGDDCLQRVAGMLSAALARDAAQSAPGEGAVLARTGGEEFVVLLRGEAALDARSKAETLRFAVAAGAIRHEYSPAGDRVTLSIGVAGATPLAGEDPQVLVARADAALYRAKMAGRNRVVLEGDPAA